MTEFWLADDMIGRGPGGRRRRWVSGRGLLGCAVCLIGLIGLPGWSGESEPGEVAGGVRVPEINDQGVMTSLLTGREVRFRPRKPMEIKGVEIFFFEPDGVSVRMKADSPGCFYDSVNGKAFSDEPIRIEGDGIVITGIRYEYIASEQTMEIFESVKVVLKNMNPGELNPARTEAGAGSGTGNGAEDRMISEERL